MNPVLVLGSSNMDLVLTAARLPAPGETVLGSGYFQASGGKGANQAVAAARAGAEVTFIAALGEDAYGREALEHFRREGLNVEHIKSVAGTPSGVALILVEERGQNMIAVYPGANALLTPGDIHKLPAGLFARGGVFVAQLETPVETVAAGLRRAREGGMLTLLNPAPADEAILEGDLPQFVDVLIPNEREATKLSGIPVDGLESAEEAARELVERGFGSVVVTLGDQGCIVSMGGVNSAEYIPAVAVRAVDCVGAGDAFVGALACKLGELSTGGEDFAANLVKAAQWAARAAAISVTRPGAQPSLPTREEIDAEIKHTSLKAELRTKGIE